MRLLTITLAALLAASCLSISYSATAQSTTYLHGQTPPAHSIWLDSLEVSHITQDWHTAQAGLSVDGNALTIDGLTYAHGVGTHASSQAIIDLNGKATRFTSMVGVDDERMHSSGSVQFQVLVDNKEAVTTPILKAGDAPQLVSVDITGAKRMELDVLDGGDGISGDHADWAGAYITVTDDSAPRPEIVDIEKLLRTPPRMTMPADDPRPAIHSPTIAGTTPGKPFLFMIPATGQGPLAYSAKNLPAGLSLDRATGIITGSLARAGTTDVVVAVSGPMGRAEGTLRIVGGAHKLALTPPMGWNSWNVWGGQVDDAKVRASADAMIASGLAAHGYQYVNIDDTWEAGRDPSGNILPNKKFPDMLALASSVHAKGLRIGLYSSPGPTTCGGYTASYRHEQQDAETYAHWGFDYLKYDWCSYSQIVGNDDSLPALQTPYVLMSMALDRTSRDIVFSLCQYGMGDVWKWGSQVGGNCWRTTGDIRDNWGSLHSIYEQQDGHQVYAGPGHWNDPDMLVVGKVGWGDPQPSHLTPNEQIVHISLWCLLSAPLLIGCDMTKLDPFTKAILTNDEAIAIDQDPLGKPARRVSVNPNGGEIWARRLKDGSEAVGLINPAIAAQTVTVSWKALGLKGNQKVRDLWLHKDEGSFAASYSVSVPAHGAVLLKIEKVN